MTRLEVKKYNNEEYLIFKGKSPLKTKMGKEITPPPGGDISA